MNKITKYLGLAFLLFLSLNAVGQCTVTPVISGNLAFCSGSSTILDALGYSSYNWSTGAITPFIVVNSAGTFSVTVTDANGCTGTASATTSISGSIPATPGPISGLNSGVCNTNSVVYSIAPVPNTTHYVWTVPPGATLISGQGSTSIIVNFSNIDSGEIVVAASNTCGQSPSANPRKITVYGGPAKPGPINGQFSGLCTNMNLVYWINPIPNTSQYNWTVPSNVTIINGLGTNAITVNMNMLNGQTGDICVSATNSCGVSPTRCLSVWMMISDTVEPVANCSNAAMSLDAQGMASADPMVIGAGSSDNCGIVSYSLSQSQFTCLDLNVNTVTLTVTDAFGNYDECTSDITITDDLDICQCFTPTGLVADNIGLNNATLNWDPTSNAVGYRLRGQQLGLPPIQVILNNGAASMFNTSNLKDKTFYYWTMQAICDNGGGTRLSAQSIIDTFRTARCDNPGNTQTTLEFNHPNRATLSWDPEPEAAGYKLFGQELGGPQVSIDMVGINNNSYFTADLMPNTTYQWIVVSGCLSNGNLIFSPSASATINTFTTLGITQKESGQLQSDIEFKLYPNPATTLLNIGIKGSNSEEQWTIKLYDMSGKLIMEEKHVSSYSESLIQLDVSWLSRGMYEVLLIGAEEIYVEKLVLD